MATEMSDLPRFGFKIYCRNCGNVAYGVELALMQHKCI